MASASPKGKKVSYYYDGDFGNFSYGNGHAMEPVRVSMAHHLIKGFGLLEHMSIHNPVPATYEQMKVFHTEDYLKFLQTISPFNVKENTDKVTLYKLEGDCPPFEGLYNFCGISAGASIQAADKLNKGDAEISINWAGGLHHAKRKEASGFCYVNDIVLAILELLKYHQRVIYIDIDIHHGDGVEQAFFQTNRVMCVSFHKYGDGFFPKSGDVKRIGAGEGTFYSVNVPLRSWMDDASFEFMFESVVSRVMETFRPGAIVLQCGADSLAGDRLGFFNLTLQGHSNSVKFLKRYNIPLLLLGGGGYTKANVARCWALETAVAVGQEVSDQLPLNDYYNHYAPEYSLSIRPLTQTNQNTPEYLHSKLYEVCENLKKITFAPSVQLQEIPGDFFSTFEYDDEEVLPVRQGSILDFPYIGQCEGDNQSDSVGEPTNPTPNSCASHDSSLQNGRQSAIRDIEAETGKFLVVSLRRCESKFTGKKV